MYEEALILTINRSMSPFFTSSLISFRTTQELIWQTGMSSENDEVMRD